MDSGIGTYRDKPDKIFITDGKSGDGRICGARTVWLFGILSTLGIIENKQALWTSAIVGIIVTIIGNCIMKKYKLSPLYTYSFTALISLFWFYKQPHDYPIIMLIMLAFLHVISDKQLTKIGRWLTAAIVVIYTCISNIYPTFITEKLKMLFDLLGADSVYETLEKIATSPYLLYFFSIGWFFVIMTILDINNKNGKLKACLVSKTYIKG